MGGGGGMGTKGNKVVNVFPQNLLDSRHVLDC